MPIMEISWRDRDGGSYAVIRTSVGRHIVVVNEVKRCWLTALFFGPSYWVAGKKRLKSRQMVESGRFGTREGAKAHLESIFKVRK